MARTAYNANLDPQVWRIAGWVAILLILATMCFPLLMITTTTVTWWATGIIPFSLDMILGTIAVMTCGNLIFTLMLDNFRKNAHIRYLVANRN